MESVRWLYDLQHFGVKLGLENIRALLRILDHPERSYSSVIVAGTNGKGSVAAMLQAMLCASGVESGLLTSPHLVRPNERIRICDRDIDDDDLDRLLRRMRERIEQALDDGDLAVHPSFFEVVTATALEAFRERSVRVAVLEVGLGGRLDATNAVDADLAVIVGVDLDHVKSLGTTVGQIAEEKAGVIKHGKPVVSGAVRQPAIDVIRRVCAERRAPFIDANSAVELVAEDGETFTLKTATHLYPELRLSLPGRHQIANARVAIAAFEALSTTIDFEAGTGPVREALASVRWPGRLEWLRGAAGRPDVLLDGAHNPASAHALASYLRTVARPAPRVLFGAMHGKLLPEMFDALAPVVGSMLITRPGVRRAEDPEVVAEFARRAGIGAVEVIEDPASAFRALLERTVDDAFALVTGSLYLVGEILALVRHDGVPGPVSM